MIQSVWTGLECMFSYAKVSDEFELVHIIFQLGRKLGLSITTLLGGFVVVWSKKHRSEYIYIYIYIYIHAVHLTVALIWWLLDHQI